MAELVYALVLGTSTARFKSSSLFLPTKIMKITVDSKKGLTTKFQIKVEKKFIDGKMLNKIEELKKTVNLKGFRPGKVPGEVLKRQFGKAIYGEVIDNILKETSSKTIEEKKIKLASQPKIELKTFSEGKDLEYSMEITELPKINIKKIEDIKYRSYDIEVSKEETEKRLSEISKNQNNFEDKKDNEVAQKGDMIIFDYKATVNKKDFEGNSGKNIQIILGRDLFIKGFDDQLTNSKKNSEKKIIVNLPENFPKKELANQKAEFDCKIINIKKPIPVVVNDEFAKTLGAKDLNDLKDIIKKQITNEYKNTLDQITNNTILKSLEDFSNFEIPENLIKQESELISQGLNEEDKKKENDKNILLAKKRVKVGLILNEIGEQNNLKVTEEEIKKEIEKQIRSMPQQSKQLIEYYQKNPSAAAHLRGRIYEEKILNLIKSKAKSTNSILNTKEAEKIILEENKKSLSTEKDNKKPSISAKPSKKKIKKKKKINK